MWDIFGYVIAYIVGIYISYGLLYNIYTGWDDDVPVTNEEAGMMFLLSVIWIVFWPLVLLIYPGPFIARFFAKIRQKINDLLSPKNKV